MSTLVSNDSTISEEVPIDYENKVAIYDDYCDDLYATKNNDNHETCHHDFNFQSHDSYFVVFAPTTMNENKFAYVESSQNFMLVDHEKNVLCDGYIVKLIHDATKNYYERKLDIIAIPTSISSSLIIIFSGIMKKFNNTSIT